MVQCRDMEIVLGVLGENGSGKGTFIEILKTLASGPVSHKTFSKDILKRTLEIWSIPSTREHLQKLAVVMRDAYGPETLTNAMYHLVVNDPAPLVIVDGVRWETDAAMIRRFPKNRLVYINADPRIRYERVKKRNEKVGEGEKTFEQFLEEEKTPNEAMISKIGATTDFKIMNDGTREELEARVREFYEKFIAT